MNATDTPHGTRADDNRPYAVVRAECGSRAWHAVVQVQARATPDHAEFYALAGELSETLLNLDGVAGVLARQVDDYGVGRAIYDDEDANPDHRLRSAVLALAETRHALAQAHRAANQFWSAIGHIGVHHHDDERDRS